MYEGCFVNLSRDGDGFTYRVTNGKGEPMFPKQHCSEGAAVMLPVMFAGAHFNFEVVNGGIIFPDELEAEGNLFTPENVDKTAEVSIYDGHSVDQDEIIASGGTTINTSKLDILHEDANKNENNVERKKDYETMLRERHARLQQAEKDLAEKNKDFYRHGSGYVEEMEENGTFYDEIIGGKAIMEGCNEENMYYGAGALTKMPLPTKRQLDAWDAYQEALSNCKDPKEREELEHNAPLSPEVIVGLANVIRPASSTPAVKHDPVDYWAEGRHYEQIPVYSSSDTVFTTSKKIFRPDITLFDKWNAVVEMVSEMDMTVASLLTQTGIKVVFQDNPQMAMGVTVDTLFVGLDFLASNSVQELAFVMLHEAGHLINQHAARKGNRDHNLWNIATDMVINKEICDMYNVDFNDPTGGRIAMEIKDATDPTKPNAKRVVIVSDGRPSPKFVAGGVYNGKLDLSKDTADTIFKCLAEGTGEFEDIEGYDPTKIIIEPPRKGPDGDGPDGDDGDDDDTPRIEYTDEWRWPEEEHIPGGGGGGGGGHHGPQVIHKLTMPAQLKRVIVRYAQMASDGVDSEGNPLPAESVAAAKKICAKYFGRLGLKVINGKVVDTKRPAQQKLAGAVAKGYKF